MDIITTFRRLLQHNALNAVLIGYVYIRKSTARLLVRWQGVPV